MKLNPDDPRLTAYALGELSAPERAEIEKAIQGDEALQQAVAEVRQVGSLLSEELREGPALSAGNLDVIEAEIAHRKWKAKSRRSRWLVAGMGAAAAAVLLVTVWSVYAPSQIECRMVTLPGPEGYYLEGGGGPKWSVEGGLPPSPDYKFRSRPIELDGRRQQTGAERALAIEDARKPPFGGVPGNDSQINERLPLLRSALEAEDRSETRSLFTHRSCPVDMLRNGGADEGLRVLTERPELVKGRTPEERFGPSMPTYGHIVENPFREVTEHPLSTFSIDVDTASYAIVRNFLNRGQLPPRDAVRIEEMVNYFSYQYVPPEDEAPFSVHTEIAECPWNGEHRLARIGLKGKEISEDERAPSSLVFLLDVSGSMRPANKLPLLKQALRLLTHRLSETDRVAIVVYAGASGLVLPSTVCSNEGKGTVLASLDRLKSGGSTNGGAGIELAYRVASENFVRGGTNRVILATDGDFNVGVTNRGDLVRLIEEKAKSGVFLTVLGFGMGNLKDSNLEQLADRGNGNYAYIDTFDEAKKVFVNQLAGTLVTIAKDVKIQIEFNPAQVSAYRLVGYENRVLQKEDFNDDKKDAGDIGAGHTVTALYELVPPGKKAQVPSVDPLKYQDQTRLTEAAQRGELMTVKLRYKAPDGDKSKLISFPARDRGARYALASEDFKFAAAVASFAMLLRDSKYRGNASYGAVLELAEEAKGKDPNGYRSEFLQLVHLAYYKAAPAVWGTISTEGVELMNQGKHGEAYRIVKGFQKSYLGSPLVSDAASFLEDLRDRNRKAIDALYEQAEALDPKTEPERVGALLDKVVEAAIPDNRAYARKLAQTYRENYLGGTGDAREEVVRMAERSYETYRRAMQACTAIKDYRGASRRAEGFAGEMEQQAKREAAEADQAVWRKYLKCAEVDRASLALVGERWSKGVKRWFEERRGKWIKVGTIQGTLEDYRDGRLFVRSGEDMFTEPSYVLDAGEMMRLAFPARETLIGEEVIERGWWLLYQEDIAGARKAEQSARELHVDTRDLREAIERWVYSDWQLSPLFAAKGSTRPDGVVQLFYDFSNRGQATDWFAVEGEFQAVGKRMFPVSAVSANGCHIQNQLPIIGDTEISLEAEFQTQESVLRLGFMRPEGRGREYHYVEFSPRRVGHWIGKHITQTAGNANKPKILSPLPVNKKVHVTLGWAADTLTLYVDQHQLYIYKYPRTGAWTPLIGSKEDRVVIDNILILGQPAPDWLRSQRPALWLAQEKQRGEGWAPLFTGKNLEGWRQYGRGRWTVAGDGLLEGEGLNATLETGHKEWRNYIISAKVRIKPGSTVRLLLRREPGADGTKDATQFVFSCGAYVDCGVYDGKTYDWFKSNDFIGAWHTHWHDLTIAAKGDLYSIFIDGRLYSQVQSGRLTSGKVGLYSHGPSTWKDIRVKLLH